MKSAQIQKNGFTLIELLVVISIIAVLMALSFAGFSQARKISRDSKRKADIEQIRSAIELYRTDVGSYPSTISIPADCGSHSLASATDTYMASIPTDPSCPNQYYRYNRIDPNHYCLCSRLETLSASVGSCDCGGDCGGGITCNYKVSNP